MICSFRHFAKEGFILSFAIASNERACMDRLKGIAELHSKTLTVVFLRIGSGAQMDGQWSGVCLNPSPSLLSL